MAEADLPQYREILDEFLEKYADYTRLHRSGFHSHASTADARKWLQRKTTLLVRVISQSVDSEMLTYSIGNRSFSFHTMLALTLLEDTPETEVLWDSATSYVTAVINEGIGNIENNALPSNEIEPVLPIRDEILRRRCLDLLQGEADFDRAINQATLVLEARLRDSIPYEKLCEVIPEDKDRIGEPLAGKLLSPSNPVVVVSDKPSERVAFLKVVVGIIAYFRNPSHHILDDKIKPSLAWSVVGVIDSLLSQLKNSYVADDTGDKKRQTRRKLKPLSIRV